jgi:putative acetyltransferase
MPLQEGVFRVQPEDFARVVEVWEASVRATHHFITEANIQFFKPLVSDAIPASNAYCVRDSDGVVAGYTTVANGNIDMLFVHPSWRGQGVGSRLVQYAIDTLGATMVDVNEQNEQALGFYLRMGFEVIGRSELDGTGKPYPLLHMRLVTKHSTP